MPFDQQTGLTQACIDSPLSHAEVEAKVLEYIKTRIPDQRLAVLAGNTVHADLAFLKLEEGRGMKSVVDWLHYVRPLGSPLLVFERASY